MGARFRSGLLPPVERWCIAAAAVATIVAAAGTTPASACPGAELCLVEDGAYLAVPPAGWDGDSPLPVTVYFHGWHGTAEGTHGNETLRRACRGGVRRR